MSGSGVAVPVQAARCNLLKVGGNDSWDLGLRLGKCDSHESSINSSEPESTWTAVCRNKAMKTNLFAGSGIKEDGRGNTKKRKPAAATLPE